MVSAVLKLGHARGGEAVTGSQTQLWQPSRTLHDSTQYTVQCDKHRLAPLWNALRDRPQHTHTRYPNPLRHRHSHFNDQSDDEDQDCCRICRGSAPPLFYPCKCSGSIKYVHQQCLMDWLGHSGNTHCEVGSEAAAPGCHSIRMFKCSTDGNCSQQQACGWRHYTMV